MQPSPALRTRSPNGLAAPRLLEPLSGPTLRLARLRARVLAHGVHSGPIACRPTSALVDHEGQNRASTSLRARSTAGDHRIPLHARDVRETPLPSARDAVTIILARGEDRARSETVVSKGVKLSGIIFGLWRILLCRPGESRGPYRRASMITTTRRHIIARGMDPDFRRDDPEDVAISRLR